jgi:hypothetical protein
VDHNKYEAMYSDQSFWDKMKKFAKVAGVKGVYAAGCASRPCASCWLRG